MFSKIVSIYNVSLNLSGGGFLPLYILSGQILNC
jgi:hypothetical protein